MKNFKVLVVILLAVFLSGCITAGAIKGKVTEKVLTLTEKDLRTGYELALANQDILGEDDQWGVCYLKIADAIKRIGGTETEGGLLFTAAMRLHILERMKANLENEVKGACGAVFFDIMLHAAKKLPGVG